MSNISSRIDVFVKNNNGWSQNIIKQNTLPYQNSSSIKRIVWV